MPDCDACRELYAHRKKKGIKPDSPPCHRCRPVLRPGNEDAWTVYQLCCRQVITAGMGEVIGLSADAVWRAIDELGITGRDRVETYTRVMRTFSDVLQREKDQGRDRQTEIHHRS